MRHKKTHAAVINGKKTALARSMENDRALYCWYYIQFPCKGWREFDIRDMTEIDDLQFMNEVLDSKDVLAMVAERLKDVDVFTKILNPKPPVQLPQRIYTPEELTASLDVPF